MKSAVLILLTTGLVLGSSMVQTDWSGGPSGEVTTTDWGSDFGSCYGMGWQASGSLILGTAMMWSRVFDGADEFLYRTATVNSDAYTDVFMCTSSAIGAILSTGNQNQWSIQTVGFADSIVTIFAGDLNGDGIDDTIGGADSLFWWENPGYPGGEWQKRLVETMDPVSGVVVDLDGDGINDIISMLNDYINNSARLLFYKNLGDGLTWIKSVLYIHDVAGGYSGPEMAAAYITGDGNLSVAVMLMQEPASMVYILREGPSGWYAYKIVSPPCINADRVFPNFVDLDTDGTADLMVGGQSYDYGRIRWYKGPEFYPYYNLETNDNVYGLAVIDYDSDGDMDIIYRGENSVGMFENTRSPQERFVQRILMEYPFSNGLDSESAGGLVAPGDFDGNGVEDFVCSFYGVYYPNLYWWRLGDDFCSSGWLNSDILYVYDASWGELSWEASVPAETQLYFQVRGSDDPGNLGEWSELLYAAVDLSAYLADGESYLQYRVTMLSDNPDVSPQLNSVTVSYDPLGVEGNTGFGLRVFPSPVGSVATVSLTLPEPAECTVAVYSLDGRLVDTVFDGSFPSGESALVWDASSVPSGVYFVRVSGSGLNAGVRLVVVR